MVESTNKCNTRKNYNKSLKNSSFGGRKIQFFPGPAVQYQLYGVNELVRKFVKISPFGDVLPDQLVGVLYSALLSGGVAVGEIHVSMQLPGDLLVSAELGAVVGGDCQDILPVGPQQLHHLLGHALRRFPMRGPCHQQVVPATLAQGQYTALLSFPYYCVHLSVAEPLPVGLRRMVMYVHTILDVPDFGRTRTLLVGPALHSVAAVLPKLPALVFTDHPVYPLVGYRDTLLGKQSRYLARGPVLSHHKPPGFPERVRSRLSRAFSSAAIQP